MIDPTPRTAATAREQMHDFEEATGAECCCGNLDAPARRRADRNNHPAFGDRFGHDWDFNYQCLRCLGYEHDPRINEPCPGIALAAPAPTPSDDVEAVRGPDGFMVLSSEAPTPSVSVERCVRGVYAVHAGIPTVVSCGEPHDAEAHEQGAPDYDHPFTPATRDE